jgi:hypothetical protein
MSGWDKFTNEEKKEICKKGSITIKEKHDRGENVSYYKGHNQSEETKEKIRQARYNYLSDKK